MASEAHKRELFNLYLIHRQTITERLAQFARLWHECSEADLFRELAFCLLTPQSKARQCWQAVECLCDNGLLFGGNRTDIATELRSKVRFHNNKAEYLVRARELFTAGGALQVRTTLLAQGHPIEMRRWLAERVVGMGYKEASHFLRNVGQGEDLAILDRHILRNLATYGVIDRMPTSLSRKKYLDIERAMRSFAASLGMPLAHLDMVLWCKETGEVFK
jgi:N-glycosylase/DNA lyase